VAACGVVGWGRAILLFPSESMIVFTGNEQGLAVIAVTLLCDPMATAGCDEGHRFHVPSDSKL